MSILKAIGAGIAGAIVLSAVNETARQYIDDAPRLDLLGKRMIALPLLKAGITPPKDDELYRISMAGDIVANTLYFSLVAAGGGKNVYKTGALLGLAAGGGTVVLPKYLHLGSAPSARTNQTAAMTIAWYLIGGLTAAAVFNALSDNRNKS